MGNSVNTSIAMPAATGHTDLCVYASRVLLVEVGCAKPKSKRVILKAMFSTLTMMLLLATSR